jgi:hypothetical protein
MLALLSLAWAHHDAGVGRVGGTPLGFDRLAGGVEAPRLELELGFDRVDLRRTLRGSSPYASPLGTATSHAWTLSVGVTTRKGMSILVDVPFGHVRASPASGEPQSLLGPGDVGLHLAQRVGARVDRVGGWARVGLLAPTGRVNEGPAFQAVDVTGGDGTLKVTTFDTRASLGAGAFTGMAGAGVRVPLGPHALTADALAGTPLHRTSDGISWGADLAGRVGSIVAAGRWNMGIAADLRRHGKDDVPGLDEQTGEFTTARLGGRISTGLELSIAARVEQVACRARARAPIWQHVGSVQLGETLEVGLRCRLDVPLRRG